MKSQILLIDVGNRRLKWATVYGEADGVAEWRQNCIARDATVWTPEFYSAETLARHCGLDKLPRPESVWVACVARPKIAATIEKYANAVWNISPTFITAHAAAAGVVNGYAEPQKLGADRWAALVAAAKLWPRKTAIIVDAGTAVTVDLLTADGKHQGGVILPGAGVMQNALSARAEKINAANDIAAADDKLQPLATDTETAVRSGVWLAVVGGVEQAVARMRESTPTDCVVLTGGDAKRIAPLLSVNTQTEPDLVLRGLQIIVAGDAR